MKQKLYLNLILTAVCDSNCEYCPSKKRSVTKNRHEMKDAVLKKLGQLIIKSPFNEISITFQGGEPLLVWEKIYNFTRFLKKYLYGKNIRFSLNTNGHFLTKEQIIFFKNNKFEITISCDGNSHSHLLHRRIRNKTQQANLAFYKKIIKNIENCVKYGISVRINMVVTPKTVVSLSSNYLFLQKLGVKFVDISPVIGWPWRRKDLWIFQEELIKLRRIKQIYSQPDFINNLNNKIKDFLYFMGYLKKHFDNVLFYTIDCDGGIYSDEFISLNEKAKKALFLCNIFDVNNFIEIPSAKINIHKLIKAGNAFSKDIFKSVFNSHRILLEHYLDIIKTHQ